MTIGPNILILPPLNPVHVAEEAATLMSSTRTGPTIHRFQRLG